MTKKIKKEITDNVIKTEKLIARKSIIEKIAKLQNEIKRSTEIKIKNHAEQRCFGQKTHVENTLNSM